MRTLQMLSLAMILAIGGIEGRAPHKKTINGEVVNTQMNKVDIAADDVCYWQAHKNRIQCSSGKIIKNPIQRESALTGTPGYLSGAGYIGYVVTKPSTPNLMGSGKRVDLYLRPSGEDSVKMKK